MTRVAVACEYALPDLMMNHLLTLFVRRNMNAGLHLSLSDIGAQKQAIFDSLGFRRGFHSALLLICNLGSNLFLTSRCRLRDLSMNRKTTLYQANLRPFDVL